MKTGLECNIEDVFSRFCELTTSEMNKTLKKALRVGAQRLKTQTISNAKSGIKTINNDAWYDGKRIFYGDDVTDAVMISKMDNKIGEELSQKVHVMGNRNADSQTYKFRFLEKGTKERYARKGRNRRHELINLRKPRYLGRISGRWFFKNAQNQVIPELPSLFMQEIDKCINKLNNTKI